MIDTQNAKEIADFKGENGPQTPAKLFDLNTGDPLAIPQFKTIEGAAMSYNNWRDVERLVQTITHIATGFEENFNSNNVPFISVGAKHGNACGASVGNDTSEVLEKMMKGNPRSIFGGVIISNFKIDVKEAEVIAKIQSKLDGIIAPEITPEAIAVLKRAKDRCRFVVNPALSKLTKNSLDQSPRFVSVRGGYLEQPNYTFIMNLESLDMKKSGDATGQQKYDLILAWGVGATSNSNTITLVKNGQLIGNGVGQQDRVEAADLAIRRAKGAGHEVKGAVAYSDSFFPFPDGPETLIAAGVEAILTSSGSIKDGETENVCQKNNVPLFMIPDAIGRGFYAH